ncbi:hypothetical protein O9G_005138 [Rozella allomycis CSF55]|uniref:Uncharacterized protein n=1 Tax=Rozella allomycis (strain CSF55) TaxID=988480 RepID=A0A075AZ79_ROZAC|nr:hypothetical protein O9G_005138 [Rozella allomycis CSF55]|eukprot:EPZ35572.1 hypothetical protein O9G_005138 [Rozella allomycis CSF55]
MKFFYCHVFIIIAYVLHVSGFPAGLDLQEYGRNNQKLKEVLKDVDDDEQLKNVQVIEQIKPSFSKALKEFRAVSYVDGVVKRGSQEAAEIEKIANDANDLMDNYCSVVVSQVMEGLESCIENLQNTLVILGRFLEAVIDQKNYPKLCQQLTSRIKDVEDTYHEFGDLEKTVTEYVNKFSKLVISMDSLKSDIVALCRKERDHIMDDFCGTFEEIILDGKKQAINKHYVESDDDGRKALLLTLAIYVKKKAMDGANDFSLDFEPKDDHVVIFNDDQADCIPYHDVCRALQCVTNKIPEVDEFLEKLNEVSSHIRVHKNAIMRVKNKCKPLTRIVKNVAKENVETSDRDEIEDEITSACRFTAAMIRYSDIFLKALENFNKF